MSLFVDTSVWSLALRRDSPPEGSEVRRLREALGSGETVYTTGLVLQELLQGWRGPRAGAQIIDRFADIAMIVPTRGDHIDAAHLRNECRRHHRCVAYPALHRPQTCHAVNRSGFQPHRGLHIASALVRTMTLRLENRPKDSRI